MGFDPFQSGSLSLQFEISVLEFLCPLDIAVLFLRGVLFAAIGEKDEGVAIDKAVETESRPAAEFEQAAGGIQQLEHFPISDFRCIGKELDLAADNLEALGVVPLEFQKMNGCREFVMESQGRDRPGSPTVDKENWNLKRFFHV